MKYMELRLKNLVWYLLVGQVLCFLVAVLQNFFVASEESLLVEEKYFVLAFYFKYVHFTVNLFKERHS